MTPTSLPSPLPLNFPQTFLADRRLLGQLLEFAERGGTGTIETIGDATGIPTGQSTGKVEPMIHYARGMGLVQAWKANGVWQLQASLLGRMVLQEDAFLAEPLTLWLLHLLLSRRLGRAVPAVGLADPWFQLFAEGRLRLGEQVDQEAYTRLLVERHGAKGYLKGLAALVLRMYRERAAFGDAGILSRTGADGAERFVREPAPFEVPFFPAYAVFLWLLWDESYPDVAQLSFDEMVHETRFLTLLGWDGARAAAWLDWLSDERLAQLDRYTGSVMVLRLVSTEVIVGRLYHELI
ncbi:hypothetical protein CKO25_09170 [Thiocapsa imhoffii]|uniref:DUF4007 family protein n=1 Tax=Thiocapsa imhoffii TaxID=382777 RepID=A0A9X0WHV4_9GAMM|nr:hypothetical protein [Thiocapsa imhoffii]MBK1644816.1 hypothetical protein [Thiocapsa imhoffii]